MNYETVEHIQKGESKTLELKEALPKNENCKEQGLPTPKIEEKNDSFDVEIIRPRTITYDSKRLSDDKPAIPSENRRKKLLPRPITTDYDRLRSKNSLG